MASSPFSNPSKPVGIRLYELLEQPQEPFIMEVYLLQNRCSGRIIRSQPSPSCWPLNAAGKKLRKFGSHGGIGRSRAAGFMKLVLVKLVYSKAVRKVLHLDMTTTAKKRSTIFDFFSLESKDQLSPVSVLELQPANERSPDDKQNELPLLPSMDSPKETHAKSLFYKKVKFSNRRRLLFDCLSEPDDRIWSFHGLNSDIFEEARNEPSLIHIAVASESARFREEWNNFESGTREIGLCLEAAILDDLKEEAIFDMLNLNFN